MKNMIRRAVRTFIQTAAGYITANAALTVAGMGDKDAFWQVMGALLTSAVAAGLAAVMNLPEKGEKG